MNMHTIIRTVNKSVVKPTKYLAKRKLGLCSALLSSTFLLAFNAQAEQKNLDDMHKQLDIMNSIILSAIKSEPTKSRSTINSINSVYLHGQGVVFTLKSRHSSSFNTRLVMPHAPSAPMSPESGFVYKSSDDAEDIVIEFESKEQDYEQAIELFEQQREHSRELRSEQRELAYELRNTARESKDAEYQLRHVADKEKKQLEAELKKLQSKRVALEQNKALLDKKAKQAQVKRAEQRVLKSKQRVKHFDKLSNVVVDTLCTYGNGLKAVPKNEHVSLIIKAGGKNAGNHYQDRVYVFTKKDINSCANDKIDSKKLLTKANKYQF